MTLNRRLELRHWHDQVLMAATTWLCSISLAFGQALPHQSPNQTVGTVNCASSTCHGSIAERDATPVLQNEYSTWLRQDPHTQAFHVLKNEQSRRIAKNLRLPKPAHESQVCLDCHSHKPAQALQGVRFDPTEGVGCEGCHGPAEKWIKTHVEPDATHQKNMANGLYPTSQPAALAKLCVSCHVGDTSRPITHQIMGAGHPRLAFELDTFLQLQPPHYRIDADWQKRKGQFDSAELWVAGQFAIAREALDVIANPARNRQGVMPELLMFDCHACHTPMKKTDWAPHMGASPGQARLNDSSLMMVLLITRASLPELATAFHKQIEELNRQATSPQGDFQRLQASAMQLQKQLDTAELRLRYKTLSVSELQAMLGQILTLAQADQFTDFAKAEQATMSISAIVAGLNNRGQSLQLGAVNQGLRSLLALLADDDQFNRAAFQAELLTLRKALGSTP